MVVVYDSLWIMFAVWVSSLGMSYWRKSFLLRGMAIMTGFIMSIAVRYYFADPPDLVPLGNLFSFVLLAFNLGLLVGVLFQE